MVFYYTSGNIKMIRNIIQEYNDTSDISPCEYIKSYIEKCSDNEDAKISWIADTFLGILKHDDFLKALASHLSEELSIEDQDYFMIIFYALMTDVELNDMQLLYKCLLKLSKSLLSSLTGFLSNNEVFHFIAQVAQPSFDTHYISDKIIGPLFKWQPCIKEMANRFTEFNRKNENRKIKPLTIPIQPNVLNRKAKESATLGTQAALPATPPNSLNMINSKKMVTKSTIDKNLKIIHEKNKQKAEKMLRDVRKNNLHYAQEKSGRYYQTLDSIREKSESDMNNQPKQRQKFVLKHPRTQIKDTTTTLKRMNKRIQSAEEQEIMWLQDVMTCCKNTRKVEELEEHDREERERERIFDIERKHLIGQISYEEALIAKKKVQEHNKRKYQEFLKEKETWNEQINEWKKSEDEKNRKSAEKLSIIEFNLKQARQNAVNQKKETVEKLKKESEEMLKTALQAKQQELDRKIAMIKEIKILTLIANKAKVPKIIDLTESSGLGLLCEMSIAELQERVTAMKIALKDELDIKRDRIKNEQLTTKQELENTKKSIQIYLNERALIRKQKNKLIAHEEVASSNKEIDDLKKRLEEKRKFRMQLTN